MRTVNRLAGCLRDRGKLWAFPWQDPPREGAQQMGLSDSFSEPPPQQRSSATSPSMHHSTWLGLGASASSLQGGHADDTHLGGLAQVPLQGSVQARALRSRDTESSTPRGAPQGPPTLPQKNRGLCPVGGGGAPRRGEAA